MPERRRFERTKISKAAKVIFGGHDPSLVDCFVFNLSRGGACVHVENCGRPIPDDVELTFDAARTLRAGRIAWQLNGWFGLEFLKQPKIDR